jgi:carbonic anhydrase
MRFLPRLFDNNRKWAIEQVSRDPQYFSRLCGIQRPEYLWIGCSDSRVPANTIVGLAPGEVFVHRNVANVVRPDDPNCLSVVQYAVDVLRVSHIIVCGHYRCGGVLAAMGPSIAEPLEGWLDPIRNLSRVHGEELAALADEGNAWNRLCELNVRSQVSVLRSLPSLRKAWSEGRQLVIHGWIYDLADGLLRDLDVSVTNGGR